MTFLVIIDIKARHYFVCCRSGKFLGNPNKELHPKRDYKNHERLMELVFHGCMLMNIKVVRLMFSTFQHTLAMN